MEGRAASRRRRAVSNMSINRVNISGNITRDPEMRQSQSGTPILTFGVAVNDRRRNQQTGEWEDYANFVDCVVFGNRAESLGRILVKGMKVTIDGKLRYSSWEREGQRRSKLEVIVDDLDFMSQRQGGSQQYGGAPAEYGRPSYATPAPAQPTYAAPPQGYAPQAPAQPMPAQQASAQPMPVQRVPPQPMPAPAQPQAVASAQVPAPQPAQEAAPTPGVQAPPSPDVYDEDIPF